MAIDHFRSNSLYTYQTPSMNPKTSSNKRVCANEHLPVPPAKQCRRDPEELKEVTPDAGAFADVYGDKDNPLIPRFPNGPDGGLAYSMVEARTKLGASADAVKRFYRRQRDHGTTSFYDS
jgi:hypothetical protein